MIAAGLIDVFEILAYNFPQWQRCVSVSGSLSVEFPHGANPVNLRTIGMVSIKCCLIFVSKIGNNTAGNGYSHTEHIDEDEELVLHHISEGNEEEIFEHTEVIRDRTKTLNYHPGLRLRAK